MEGGVPLFGVEFVVFFYFVVDGFGVVGGDVFVDQLDVVLGEELLDVVDLLRGALAGVFLHH